MGWRNPDVQWLASFAGLVYHRSDRLPGGEGEAGPIKRIFRVNIPNLVTMGRILLVPIIVWAIGSGQVTVAFVLFLAAGISDAVDGFLAKHFGMQTDLGALLDPIADKALLVSIYVALGIAGEIPRWLVILVVSRDIMIVGAVIVSWLVDRPIPMKPLLVSKLNTVVQVLFAALVLAAVGFGFRLGPWNWAAMGLVAALTLLSVAAYLREWVRHMSGDAV